MHKLKHKPKKKKEQQKMIDTDKVDTPKPKPEQTSTKPIDPNDRIYIEGLMSSHIGKGLIRVLAPLARTDLHPGNLAINYHPTLQSVDIFIGLIDINTPLWVNLQMFMWSNRMTWRWDVQGPQNQLVVRWFLPYEFPEKMRNFLAEHFIKNPLPPIEPPIEPPTVGPPEANEESPSKEPPGAKEELQSIHPPTDKPQPPWFPWCAPL